MKREEVLKQIESEQKKLNDSLRILEFVMKCRRSIEESKQLLKGKYGK